MVYIGVCASLVGFLIILLSIFHIPYNEIKYGEKLCRYLGPLLLIFGFIMIIVGVIKDF